MASPPPTSWSQPCLSRDMIPFSLSGLWGQACHSREVSETQSPKAGRALETLAHKPFPKNRPKAELLQTPPFSHPFSSLDGPWASHRILLQNPSLVRGLDRSAADSHAASSQSRSLTSKCWARGFSLAGQQGFPAGSCPLGGEGGRKTPHRGQRAGRRLLPLLPPFSAPPPPGRAALFPSSMALVRPGSRKQVFGEGILLGEERQAQSLVLQRHGNLS